MKTMAEYYDEDFDCSDYHPYAKIAHQIFAPRLGTVSPGDERMLHSILRGCVLAASRKGIGTRYEIRRVSPTEVHIVVFVDECPQCLVFETPELEPGVAERLNADEVAD